MKSWIKRHLTTDVGYDYYCLDLDQHEIANEMRAAYFIEYNRLLKLYDFDADVYEVVMEMTKEKNIMVPLNKYVKNGVLILLVFLIRMIS